MRKTLFSLLAVSALAAASVPAQAQYNADSITDALTPNAPSATRGIRQPGAVPPAAVPPAATQPVPAAGSVPYSPPPATARPRPGTVPATAAVPMHRPAAPTTQADGTPSINLTVQFATNSAMLTPAATHTLDELGRALSGNRLANYRFRIEGHTDTTGTTDRNQALSEARAQAVVEYLTTHFGIDRGRLEPVGMGESQPLVPTGQHVAEPRNRRVTVVNLGT